MIQIDIPQGGRRPSIPGIIRKPVQVVVTPKPRKEPLPVKKPNKGNIWQDLGNIIVGGGSAIIGATPLRPGEGGSIIPTLTVDPLPTNPIRIPEVTLPPLPSLPPFPDLGLPGLPAFPDLGLPSIGKFFDDLKVGGGLILLGIGGLVALFILTRNK